MNPDWLEPRGKRQYREPGLAGQTTVGREPGGHWRRIVQFRAVFFDFGGTLFSYRPLRDRFDRLLVETAARHGIEAPAAELRRAYARAIRPVGRAYADRPFYRHRDLFGDMGAAYVRALGAQTRSDTRSRFYLGQTEVALPAIEPRDGTVEALRELRARGLHVGVVSNIDDDQFELLWRHCGLGPLVDATTTSEQAGSCKPHPDIFHAALTKTEGVPPREVVFVGDSVDHDVAGANPLGMTSVLIETRAPAADAPHQPAHVISDPRELLAIVDS